MSAHRLDVRPSIATTPSSRTPPIEQVCAHVAFLQKKVEDCQSRIIKTEKHIRKQNAKIKWLEQQHATAMPAEENERLKKMHPISALAMGPSARTPPREQMSVHHPLPDVPPSISALATTPLPRTPPREQMSAHPPFPDVLPSISTLMTSPSVPPRTSNQLTAVTSATTRMGLTELLCPVPSCQAQFMGHFAMDSLRRHLRSRVRCTQHQEEYKSWARTRKSFDCALNTADTSLQCPVKECGKKFTGIRKHDYLNRHLKGTGYRCEQHQKEYDIRGNPSAKAPSYPQLACPFCQGRQYTGPGGKDNFNRHLKKKHTTYYV